MKKRDRILIGCLLVLLLLVISIMWMSREKPLAEKTDRIRQTGGRVESRAPGGLGFRRTQGKHGGALLAAGAAGGASGALFRRGYQENADDVPDPRSG